MVKVVFSSILAQATRGEREVVIHASTVSEALRVLVERYGDAFRDRIFDENNRVRRFVNIYVNGKDIRFLKGVDTPLKEDDELQILPAISGG